MKRNMKLDYLRGKKIAILGFSIEGLSVARFLDRHGLSFTILEKNEPGKLLPEAQEFIKTHDYPLITGASHLDKLSEFNLISRSQGIPLWNPKIAEAKKSGVEFTSVTKLFFDLCPCQIIGVTGTKGKGTTATLIYEMLKASKLDVYLGGNIGKPPLDFIDDLKPTSWTILELSSFQLEDLEKSPQLAVVLMVTQEHLNSQAVDSPNYHRSINDYFEAKKNIVRYQSKDNFVIVNTDYPNSVDLTKEAKSKVIYFSTENDLAEGSYLNDESLLMCLNDKCQLITKRGEVFLRGNHNLQNVLAASTAASIAGANISDIGAVIKTFKGLEHRLEFVRDMDGVKFYNDSFSTTPETAIAAIKSFTEPEIIILGGSEKGSDYMRLSHVIAKATNIRAVLLIGVTAGQIEMALKQCLIGIIPKKGIIPINLGRGLSMDDILAKANSLVKPGDVVLLSPACASYDMFKNYKDRGQQFKDCVNQL